MDQMIRNSFYVAHRHAQQLVILPTGVNCVGSFRTGVFVMGSYLQCDFLTDLAMDQLWRGLVSLQLTEPSSILCKEGSLGSTSGKTY